MEYDRYYDLFKRLPPHPPRCVRAVGRGAGGVGASVAARERPRPRGGFPGASQALGRAGRWPTPRVRDGSPMSCSPPPHPRGSHTQPQGHPFPRVTDRGACGGYALLGWVHLVITTTGSRRGRRPVRPVRERWVGHAHRKDTLTRSLGVLGGVGVRVGSGNNPWSLPGVGRDPALGRFARGGMVLVWSWN